MSAALALDIAGDGRGDARRAQRRAAGRRSPASPSTAAPSSRARPISRSRAMCMTAMTSSTAALKAGAALAPWSRRAQRGKFAADAPLLVVDDVLEGLRDLARASRARLKGAGDRGHRLGRQDLDQGSAARACCRRRARPTPPSPPSTITGACRCRWRAARRARASPSFEIGMNHAGEIEPLVKMVRPHVAIITTVEPVHLEFFAGIEAIADAKAEIFAGVEPGGAAVLNRDNSQFARLAADAQARGVSRIVSFGSDAKSEARLLDLSLHATSSAVHANILGHDVTYKLGMPGRHMAMNSLAVLAAASLAGADLALAALAMSQVEAGRRPRRAARAGSRQRRGDPDRRELQRQSGLDGRRHQRARPGRDRPAGPAHRRARRHARTRPDRSDLASRPRGSRESQPDRPGLLLRSADA